MRPGGLLLRVAATAAQSGIDDLARRHASVLVHDRRESSPLTSVGAVTGDRT